MDFSYNPCFVRTILFSCVIDCNGVSHKFKKSMLIQMEHDGKFNE